MTALFLALAITVHAAQPAWWTATDGPLNGNPANDYQAVTQGQLKQFTQKAAKYLDANLTNGAGATLDGTIAAWSNYYVANGYSSTNPAPADLKLVNQAQLKYIAHLVYPALAISGYMSTNYASWAQTNSGDFKVANAGQLKQIFNFEIATPGSPYGLTVVQGSTNATFTWNEPVVSVATYTIQYSTDGGVTWTNLTTITGDLNSITVNGLTSGTNYLFRAIASNTSGSSSPSTNDTAPIITLSNPSGATLIP